MTITASFMTAFGQEPAATARANGRVNLIGEHLDYNGGMVLPTAIDRFVAVAVSPGQSDGHRIWSSLFSEMAPRSLEDTRNGHWSDYVTGALRKAQALGLINAPVDVAVESTVPHGAGLSSSAAVIVATLKAVMALTGGNSDNVAIARWAQEVEHDFIGVPCGIMDQMAVAIAGEGQALALDTARLGYTLVDLPEEYHFAVVHSGITRQLEDGRYAERRRECESAAKMLGADDLCLLSEGQTERLTALPQPEQRRARHAVLEHRRVLAALEALQAQDLDRFGALMVESHASMRDDFEVSTDGIDALVVGAIEAGAVGARLTGGGFGGCIVACVPKSRLESWKEALLPRFPSARFVC